MLKDFPSRDDPKYLESLEKSFLSRPAVNEDVPGLSTILCQLELLESKGQQGTSGVTTRPLGGPSKPPPGSGLGLYAGTGVRPKTLNVL